ATSSKRPLVASRGWSAPPTGYRQQGNGSLGEAAQKLDYRSADLGRALVLGPVPAAGEHPNVPQNRHDLFHIADLPSCPGRGHDYVVIACDVARRHRDLHPVECRHQLPIASDVAIVVERAAKAAARKFSGVDTEVGFAEP